MIVKVYTKILKALGYTVVAMTDPLEAYEVFSQSPDKFDIVLTDMNMPHMSGLELTRAILSQRPDLPVILITGLGDTIANDAITEIGFRELLLKPVRRQALGESVRRALNENKAD